MKTAGLVPFQGTQGHFTHKEGDKTFILTLNTSSYCLVSLSYPGYSTVDTNYRSQSRWMSSRQRRKRRSRQLENHCCRCLEAPVLLQTNTHTHTNTHTQMSDAICWQDERKGSGNKRAKISFSAFSSNPSLFLPLCSSSSLTYRHQTHRLSRLLFHLSAHIIHVY